ncbi:MAG: vitamin K epoxide reductase family protein [Anaerolineales bacterium]
MDKKLYLSMMALSVLEMGIGIYMTIYKIVYELTKDNSMCLGSGDCASVNASPYSSLFGIPVATIGFVGALLIFITLLLEMRGEKLLGKAYGKFFKQNATLIVFGLCVTGFAFNVYLVYLEFFVIKALCPFCVVSQITVTILFILSIVRLVRQPLS